MANDRVVKKLYERQPISTRPKLKWENDIKGVLRILKINNWTICIQDRVKWAVVVEKAKTFKQ
jgi:hypothetical protein